MMYQAENDKINGIVAEQIDSVIRSFIIGDIGELALIRYLMSWEKFILANSFVASVKLYAVKELMRFGYEGKWEKLQELIKEHPPESKAVEKLDWFVNQYFQGLIGSTEFIDQAGKLDSKALASMILALLDFLGGKSGKDVQPVPEHEA